MNSRKRMLQALDLHIPDRLPVTVHHVLPYYLETYHPEDGPQDFYRRFGLDPILYINQVKADSPDTWKEHIGGTALAYELSDDIGDADVIVSDRWKIKTDRSRSGDYDTWHCTIDTPKGRLSAVLQSNRQSVWVVEPLLKQFRDLDMIIDFAPFYAADAGAVNAAAANYGEKGLVRGTVPGFELFGQPGCWQDLACLVGIEQLIYAAFDDPDWVHTALSFLMERKLHYVRSLAGADYDIIALGGGDASTTVISPDMFRKFVAPYDVPLLEAAAAAGIRTVYHVCGGMMPILEDLADMGPTAVETLTPPGMGGDTDLREAKRRIGCRVCLIGGFDQGEYFIRSTSEETRKAVRTAFEQAGEGGGFILSPSDHFFDGKDELLEAFALEARSCTYSQQQ